MIHRLPDDVINRIAAGEVVERPGSVVKELMENSIDAGASRIEVAIEGGGRKLIRVVDDGAGMTPADLQAVFLRHATSKIDRAEDLLHIASLGFRGEALASIGAVSAARVTSRPRDRAEGAMVENCGGAVSAVRPAPSPPGTAVDVRDLFENVPARLKFLKTDSTELSHIVESVTRILLAFPDLEVRLVHNGHSVLHCEKNLGLLERIERCFGRDLRGSLVPVAGESGRLRVTGYAGRPETARKDLKRSYIFINGRFVRDKIVHAAVRRAFRERLPASLHPAYVLHVSMPPEDVDANVHPMKLEVRFRDGTATFAGVLGVVEESLAQRERPGSGTPWVIREAPRVAGAPPRASYDFPAAAPRVESSAQRLAFGVHGALDGSAAPEARGRVTLAAASRFLQVHGTYVLFEVAEGVAIVDQHALHERVIYRRLLQQYEGGGILLQKLLMPCVVDIEREAVHRRDELAVHLSRLGIEAEPFGPDGLKVTAVPSLVKGADSKSLVLEMIALLSSGEGGEEAYIRLLHSMACKAAVRAGDRLDEEEMAALLDFLATGSDASHCPHGRPTAVLLTRRELEEMFKRRGF